MKTVNEQNKRFMSLLFVAVACLMIAACRKEQPTETLTIEETAKLVLEYELTMNQSGLETLLCSRCPINLYQGLSMERRLVANALEERNVSFTDRKAHDFDDITCLFSSVEKGGELKIVCQGNAVLFNRKKEIESVTPVNRAINLHLEGNVLRICPPVCDQ